MAIDTVVILVISGVLWILLMTFAMAIINQNIHDYDHIMSKLDKLEKLHKEMSTHVEYLYGVANGSCKPFDFQSYYPDHWDYDWSTDFDETEDQALGETCDRA